MSKVDIIDTCIKTWLSRGHPPESPTLQESAAKCAEESRKGGLGEKMGEKMGEERCEGERETAQVSSSVGVVVNVQWSQIRDPWLRGRTPFGALVKI